ncbi:MAG TPA: TonB-dependent receptor, partial [Terriglobales bacterium]|nr:TonB-dependent receptor [Terriglobales bacterium]
SLSGGFNQAYRETNLLGKADYNLGHNAHAFYRYTYYAASLPATFAFGLSVYNTKNYTRNHVGGLDFSTGSFTHSVRFSYLKFENTIVNGLTAGLPNPGILLSSGTFFEGPNLLAPQATPQANREIKYDGTKALHSHTVRYGVSFNHIQGGGFANFYGLAPRVSWTTSAGTDSLGNPCSFDAPCAGSSAFFAANSCGAGTPCFPGGDTNPLNYPVNRLRFGNGQGFNTEHPAFGFPAGGLGPDNRLGIYLGDSWKVKPNFTVNLGLRYDRDTNRTDSDLGPIDAINQAFPGMGNPVKQANLNLAPQLGIAWDPTKNGKTVIRAGIGLFYENVIFNNVLFDRPLRLQTGAFNTVSNACLNNTAQQTTLQTNSGTPLTVPDAICGNVAVGTVIPQIQALWQQYLAGNPTDLAAANPNFIGGFLDSGAGSSGNLGLFAPNYKSPRSVQMNFGIQREIRNGMVFSADYLRNVETHSPLSVDINHDGSVANFSQAGAEAAIATTLGFCGVATIDDAIVNCPTNPTGAPGAYTPRPATIADFAGNGLGSGGDFGAGCQTDPTVVNPAGTPPCAFGGKNGKQAAFFMLQPIGRSVYNALQMKLTQNVNHPFRGVKAANFQISYSLSRLDGTGGAQVTGLAADSDQDFVLQAADNDKPGRYFGPSLLDRTHQLSFGGYVDAPGGFRFGLISHFYSPLSSAIVAPSSNTGDIFVNDFTGDGTIGDPLPGTRLGQFDRGTNAKELTALVNNYNNTVAGTLTPAGQTLVNSGLITQDQMALLGGVAQPMTAPVAGQVNYPWLKATDLRLAWRHTFKERWTIEPSVGFFNAFNFANFNLPPNTMNGQLGTAGSISTTARADNDAFRVGNGTGVYALGAARQIEWGMRLTF